MGTVTLNRGPDVSVAPRVGEGAVGITDVTKRFANGRFAVDDVSLHVAPGEFVSLIGPSGCGKSTLLRMVAGLETPSAGAVTVYGEPPVKARRQPQTLAYVFQEATLMPWRTVLHNVVLPLELQGVPPDERRRLGEAGLASVGLADCAALYPRQLSGGMRMRVSLARAMCTTPRLLLLDEPFAAIDEINRKRLNDDLHTLWHEQRFTGLFVTHNIYEAVFLSTRIVVLSDAPARIAGEVLVDAAIPRDDAFRNSAQFSRLAADVWHLLETGNGHQAHYG